MKLYGVVPGDLDRSSSAEYETRQAEDNLVFSDDDDTQKDKDDLLPDDSPIANKNQENSVIMRRSRIISTLTRALPRSKHVGEKITANSTCANES